MDDLIVLQDITPSANGDNRERYMFCAAIYNTESNDFQALAGKRPADGMTSYRFTQGIPSVRESEFTIDLRDWEDPRLLQLSNGVLLVFLQYMGKPFGVTRWFENSTFGPISKLGLKIPDTGDVVYEATKNWAPFSLDGILHVVICPHPLVVVRCESLDNVNWDICVPQGHVPSEFWTNTQDFQRSLVYRGGSNYMPYPDENSKMFVGLLHTRFQSGNIFLHVPVVHIILQAEEKWWPVWLGLVPNITGADNWSSSFAHLNVHHIQDPVSITHINGDGSIFVTLNMGDEAGRCALGVYPHTLPAMADPVNWVMRASQEYQTFNMTKAYEDSLSSLKLLLKQRLDKSE